MHNKGVNSNLNNENRYSINEKEIINDDVWISLTGLTYSLLLYLFYILLPIGLGIEGNFENSFYVGIVYSYYFSLLSWKILIFFVGLSLVNRYILLSVKLYRIIYFPLRLSLSIIVIVFFITIWSILQG
jgi:hypothetical protein